MGFFHQFPYTDLAGLNNAWILETIRKVDNALKSGFSEFFTNWVNENFNSLMLNATYDEETETITLER